MKSRYLFLLPLLLLSCQEVLQEREEAGGETVLQVGIASLETRTWLDTESGGSPVRVYWSDGDRINVNGQISSPIEVAPGQKVGSDAEFHLRSVDAPYRVVYPASAVKDAAYASDGTIGISVPSQQAWTEGSFAVGAAPLYGYAESGRVTLHNLFAAIRVRISSSDETLVSAASVSSDEASLCGDFKLNPQTGDLEALGGEGTVSLSLEAVALSPEGTDFYFTIPPGNYPGGLHFSFTRASDARSMLCSWTPEGKVNAGKLYYFDKIVFVPEAKAIETAEEWEEFAAAVNGDGDLSKYLYKDGVVRLGADIEAENLTGIKSWTGIFDGQGHSLIRTAAGSPLFSHISGTVKNLTLAGALTSTGERVGAFASYVDEGATVDNCTNSMNITVTSSGNAICGGIASTLQGGTIQNCVNSGSISVSVDCTSETKSSLQVGGIIGQIGEKTSVLKDCRNEGSVEAIPVNSNATGHNYGIKICGVGGIVGWLKGIGAISFNIENCDNEGSVKLNGASVVSPDGLYAYSSSVGGIIGIAGDISIEYGIFSSNIGANGLDVTIDDCDNSGTVHNCGISYSTTTQANTKNYTGGIVGSLVGTSSKKASLKNCTNTGTLLTYDLTGDASSTRPAYCQVVGGLVGYGGYISVNGCTVNCTIGNGKRPATAISGGIGFAMRPFEFDGCSIWFSGYWTRISGYNLNSSAVATVPLKHSGTAMVPAPSIAGSSVKNCSLGGSVYYYQLATATSTVDNTANFTEANKIKFDMSSFVRGTGYNNMTTINSDVEFDNNTKLDSAPSQRQ